MTAQLLDPSLFRKNIVNKFHSFLEDDKKSQNLEKGIFNFAIKEATIKSEVKKWENPKFVQIYTDRLKTIYLNMKNKKILDSLISGELKPQIFAFMTHQEMNPEHWKELIEKKSVIDANKYDTKLVSNTDMFTCSKCKSKNCQYYTMQTRSADEPETIFISCLDCGKHWRR